MIQNFKIIAKKELAPKIYEIVFESEKPLHFKAWQFITFLLEKIWGRAYSILKQKDKKITLIIKKWELDNWWKGWSKYICEKDIWDIFWVRTRKDLFYLEELKNLKNQNPNFDFAIYISRESNSL